jgi:putative transposase
LNKAFKFRIYPNAEQQILLAKTFGCVRFIYNKMLGDKIKYYEETKQKLNNTPAQYKAEFDWLKEVDSLALANAQMNLQTAYGNFFRSPKVGFPKFKSKKNNHQSYTTNRVGENIKLQDGYLILPKLKAVKIRQHRGIPQDYRLKAVTVSRTPSGKYFASILFEYEQQIQTIEPKNFVGLDFSMKELYVASDGSSACYPRYYRQALEQLAKEQRKLSKCQKGSNNRYKQRIKVARLHEKVANQRKDFLHKLSRQITNVYDCVCIEDLNMKGMSQALHFGKSVADNSFGAFVGMLDYKLNEQGKQLVKIDKWYPSSKTCSCCGAVKENLSLADRTYHCEHCGAVVDRDYNASINIRNEGVRLVSA